MSAALMQLATPRTYVPQEPLFVWALLNPAAPTLVGEIALSQLVADCATFRYTADWWHFALSEDLPLLPGRSGGGGANASPHSGGLAALAAARR